MDHTFLDRVSNKALGELLIEKGFISKEQCQEGLLWSKQKGLRLGEALVSLGYVSYDTLSYILGEQFGVRPIELHPDMVDAALVKCFPIELLRHHNMLPLMEVGGELTVVVSDPTDLDGLHALSALMQTHRISTQLGDPEQIRHCLSLPRITGGLHENSSRDRRNPAAGAELTTRLLNLAIASPASDVFICASNGKARAYSVDANGMASELLTFEASLLGAVMERLTRYCTPIVGTGGRALTWTNGTGDDERKVVVTTWAGLSSQWIRLRPLMRMECSPGPTEDDQFSIVAYDDPQQLARHLLPLMECAPATLLLQECIRVYFPGVFAFPSALVDVAALTASLTPRRVIFDHPVPLEQVLRVLTATSHPPAITMSAPVVSRRISPDAQAFLKEFKARVLRCVAGRDQPVRMSAEDAKHVFGGSL